MIKFSVQITNPNQEENQMKLTRGFITFLVLTLAVAGLILTGCAG